VRERAQLGANPSIRPVFGNARGRARPEPRATKAEWENINCYRHPAAPKRSIGARFLTDKERAEQNEKP
jgi:hypothetical protein